MNQSPIQVYTNLLQTPEERSECESILRGFGWRFGFKSDVNEEVQNNILYHTPSQYCRGVW